MADCGTITLVEPFSESNVSVTSCSNLPSEAPPGDTVTAEFAVENTNPQTASVTVHATTGDGTELATRTITVGGGSTGELIDIPLPSETGDISIDISVASATEASTAALTATPNGTPPGIDIARGVLESIDRETAAVGAVGAGAGGLGLALLGA